jgi:hypothetical protein
MTVEQFENRDKHTSGAPINSFHSTNYYYDDEMQKGKSKSNAPTTLPLHKRLSTLILSSIRKNFIPLKILKPPYHSLNSPFTATDDESPYLGKRTGNLLLTLLPFSKTRDFSTAFLAEIPYQVYDAKTRLSNLSHSKTVECTTFYLVLCTTCKISHYEAPKKACGYHTHLQCQIRPHNHHIRWNICCRQMQALDFSRHTPN